MRLASSSPFRLPSRSLWSIMSGPTLSTTTRQPMFFSDSYLTKLSLAISPYPITFFLLVHAFLFSPSTHHRHHPLLFLLPHCFSLCCRAFFYNFASQCLPTVPTSRRTRRNCKRSTNKKCASTSSSTCARPSPSCPARQQPTKRSTPPSEGCQTNHTDYIQYQALNNGWPTKRLLRQQSAERKAAMNNNAGPKTTAH